MSIPAIPHQLLISGFLALLALAALWDVRTYRIPHGIVFAIAGLYPFFVLSHPDLISWIGGVWSAAAVFVAGAVLFAFRAMGGGDVKLMAVTALWAGPHGVLGFLMVTAVAGGILAIVHITPLRFVVARAISGLGWPAARGFSEDGVLPYGVAIAGGGAFVAWSLLVG